MPDWTNPKNPVFRMLWIALGLLFVGLVLFGKLAELGIISWPRSAVIQLGDASWLRLKASLWDQTNSRTIDPKRIQVLDLFEPHSAQFYLSDFKKRELVSAVRKYPGYILTSIDPQLIREDKILSELLENPRFIRPVRFLAGMPSTLELEKSLASKVKGERESVIPNSFYLVPSDASYFGGAEALLGTNYLSLETQSRSVNFLDLMSRGAQHWIPSGVLTFAAQAHLCVGPQLSSNDQEVLCSSGEYSKLPRILFPLFSRVQGFERIRSVSEIKHSQVLLIDVYDPYRIYPTPRSLFESWGTITATGIQSLQAGTFLTRPIALIWGEMLFLILCVGLIVWAMRGMSSKHFLGFLFVLNFALWGIDAAATVGMQWRTDPIPLALFLICFSIVAFGERSAREFAQRSLIERALQGYVSPHRLNRLLSGEEKLQLSGQRKDLAALLLDISGFSKLIESLSPERAFDVMREFYTLIDPIIFEEGGFIDKKTGDGMLACFGDEEQGNGGGSQKVVPSAVNAALRIQERLLNHKFEGKLTLRARIGINFGSMMIGNTGSQKHFNYTLLGEAVNFTQRLEAACPEGRVLCGATVKECLNRDSRFEFQEIEIVVKHKAEPVKAYLVSRA